MARHRDDGCRRKDRLTTRRTLLKAAGVTALALGSGAVGTAGATPTSDVRTVDLAAEGLRSGESIDPYLTTHFSSDTVVHVPAGEYTYSGAGLDGSYSNAALLGSREGVVLHRPADADEPVRPTITATDGSVRLENFTITGSHDQSGSRWRVGAGSEARMELLNVNMPGAGDDDTNGTGIYAGSDHAGTLWLNSCYFSNFDTAALDVSDPYKGAGGKVAVEDCNFRDAGTAAVKLGADDSVVRGCHFAATDTPSSGSAEQPQRAIVVDGPGTNLEIDDCDFDWADAGSAPVHFALTGADGSGTIRDARLSHPGSGPTSADWDIGGAWTGENIDITEA